MKTAGDVGKRSTVRPLFRSIFGFLTVCGASVLTLVVLEYVIRWSYPIYDPSGHIRFFEDQDDGPVLGPRNTVLQQVKNTGDFNVRVAFNKFGLRDDRDITTAERDDIFVVGDSIAFGWGVEAADRVSERLEAATGRRVFNISSPGDLDNSKRLIAYAESFGAPVRRVIVIFGTEVRLIDYGNKSNAGAPAVLRREGMFLLRIKNFLMENSALYFLLTSAVHQLPPVRDLAIRAGLIVPNLEGVPIRDYSREAIVSTADRLAALVRGYDATIVVAPSRGLWTGPSRAIEERTHSEFIAELKRRDLDVLDLRPEFERGGRPFEYFFQHDSHWSPRGHALAAEFIARHMKRTGAADAEPH